MEMRIILGLRFRVVRAPLGTLTKELRMYSLWMTRRPGQSPGTHLGDLWVPVIVLVDPLVNDRDRMEPTAIQRLLAWCFAKTGMSTGNHQRETQLT